MPKCGKCHECGGPITVVLDGEEWCPVCKQYQRPKSHGWAMGEDSPCPGPDGPRLYPVPLRCRRCGCDWTEYLQLPIHVVAFITRSRAWNCPHCGAADPYLVKGGVFWPDIPEEEAHRE